VTDVDRVPIPESIGLLTVVFVLEYLADSNEDAVVELNGVDDLDTS